MSDNDKDKELELTPTQKKGIIKGVKDFIYEGADKIAERQKAQIRAKWMPRWAELSGLKPDENGNYDYSKINYDDPFILLEWHMCDPNILFGLGNDKTRAETLCTLPDKCQIAYFQTGPGNDKPYSEVYTGKSQIKHALKKNRKNKV